MSKSIFLVNMFLKQKRNPKELPSLEQKLVVVDCGTWGSVPGVSVLSRRLTQTVRHRLRGK